jgi:hypothetical protein
MKSRESCEAALRLCDSGDEIEVVEQNEVSLNIVFWVQCNSSSYAGDPGVEYWPGNRES